MVCWVCENSACPEPTWQGRSSHTGISTAAQHESSAKVGKRNFKKCCGVFLRHNTICTIEEIFSAVVVLFPFSLNVIIHHSSCREDFFCQVMPRGLSCCSSHRRMEVRRPHPTADTLLNGLGCCSVVRWRCCFKSFILKADPELMCVVCKVHLRSTLIVVSARRSYTAQS